MRNHRTWVGPAVVAVVSFVMFLSLSLPAVAKTTRVTLENGMEVIFWENHSSPMIASVVFVKAGAKYENDYNNGITHFLEHLLFDGTKNRTRLDISDGIANKGGYINAFTRRDLTGYLVLMPKEFIDYGLDIQADQLFNSIFPDEELPKERKVVIEEIQKDMDNEESVASNIFYSHAMAGTGYQRPVEGYKNIIASIPKDQIISYWKQFYAPNNMVALVIGDFDTQEMLEKYKSVFGVIPPVNLPVPPVIKYFAPTEKKIYRQDGKTKLTYVSISIDAPKFSDPDYFAFDLMSDYLSSDETSPLKKVLADVSGKPLFQSYSSSVETMPEYTRLNLEINTEDPANADKIIAGVDKVLSEFATYQPSPEVLTGLKVSKKSSQIFLAEKLHYYGFTVAPLMLATGWDFMEAYLGNIDKVTPAAMVKAAEKRFKPLKYIASVYYPEAKSSGDTKSATNTVFRKEVLPNGLTVIIKSNPDSRVFAMNILGKNRSASEPPGKTGITDFVNRMLKKGTKTLSGEELDKKLATIGAQVTVCDNPWIPYDDMYTTRQYSFLKFETIDEFTKEGLSLFAELVKNPAFDSAAVEEIRSQLMGLWGRESGQTLNSCRDLFYATLFENEAFGKSIDGTPRTLGTITREDLIDYHKKFYSPGNMILTIGTNYNADTLMAMVKDAFGSMPKVEFVAAPAKPGVAPVGVKEAHKEMAKEQIYIYIGGLVPGASDADAPAVTLAAEVLSHRLQKHLREEQGLAYSVGAGANFDKEFGWYVCTMGTGAANFAKARDGILAEMKALNASGPSADELEIAKNSMWGTSLTRRLSRINQAFYMGIDEYLGLGYDFDATRITKLRAVTADQVKAAAAKYFDTSNYVIATVGKMQ